MVTVWLGSLEIMRTSVPATPPLEPRSTSALMLSLRCAETTYLAWSTSVTLAMKWGLPSIVTCLPDLEPRKRRRSAGVTDSASFLSSVTLVELTERVGSLLSTASGSSDGVSVSAASDCISCCITRKS